MSSEIKNVVLIGAGGNLGPAVLTKFISSPFNVTVLTRPTSTSKFPDSVKVIKSDYTFESLKDAFKGQDAVVSLVGNAAFSDQTTLIDAAIAAGVKRFVPSEFGSDTANDKVVELVPIFAGKKKVVDYLVSKESEISWTGVITGVFLDWGLKVGFLGPNLTNKTAIIYDSGDAPFSTTTLSQIGTALVQVLQRASLTANKYVYVDSITTTQNKVLASVEKATGSKFEVTKLDAKETTKVNLEKLAKGDFSAVAPLIQAGIFGYAEHRYSDWSTVPGGLWNERLGLKGEDLDEVVKTVL